MEEAKVSFPEMKSVCYADFYWANEIEDWRREHRKKLVNPPKLLSLTLVDLTTLNDWIRERLEEC